MRPVDDEARAILLASEELGGDEGLVEAALGVLALASHLLDDEENLTRVGNLDGEAKKKLAQRALELLGADEDA